MQFSTLSLLAALTSLVSAQNPFNFLTTPVVKVGTPFNITWSPSTGTTDTVTLLLRQGNPNALTTVETIASSIQNTGSYLWTPGPELVNGPLYAFEIVDDGNKYITNYSGQFAISSPNTISSSFAAATTSSLSPSQSSELKSSSSNTAATTTGVSSTSTGTGALLSTATGKSASNGASTTGAATGSKTTSAASTVPSNAGTGMKASGGLLMFVGAAMAML